MAVEFDFLYVILFSIVGGVLATRFKQPSVLGVLIAGAIVGPHALGLIKSSHVVDLVIEIGAILLLFVVGIEFSVEKLLSNGVRSLIVASFKLGVVFYIGYQVALLFGLDGISALLIGVMLSITSTVIFLKILEQKGLSKRPEIALLVSILILEDIFAVFALTFVSSLGNGASLTPFVLFSKLMTSLALLGLVFIVLRRVLKPVISWLSRYSTEDTITFIALGVCAGMSSIAYIMGLSPAVGAFLAGNIVASFKNAELFEKSIHPFVLTFTALFFFAIGSIVDFEAVTKYAWLILALFVVMVLFKYLAIGFSTYLFSQTTGKGAIFSGVAMVSLGEFSLLIAKEGNNLGLGIDFVSIMAVIIFLSSLTMSSLITHCASIHRATLLLIPKGVKYDMTVASKYVRCLCLGDFFTKFRERKVLLGWRSVSNNVLGMLFVVFFLTIWYNTTQFRFVAQFLNLEYAPGVVLLVGGIFLFFPTFSIIRNLRDVSINIFRSFLKFYPKELANEAKIFRNVVFALILFVATISLPIIVTVLGLNPWWGRSSIFLLIGVLFLLTQSEQLISVMVRQNRKLFERYNRKFEKLRKRELLMWKKKEGI